MIKSNKKTFILIGIYTVILIAIIGTLVLIQNVNNKNAVTDIYITTKTIQAGETVDDTLIANKTKKVQYPVSAVKEIEKAGGTVVTAPAQISSLISTSIIPAGQPLTKQLFEAITPEIYADYTSKTFAKDTGNDWKFVTPDYIILDVTPKNTPINGFKKGEEISIEGYVKYSYTIVNTEVETSTNEDGETEENSVTNENLAEGTYHGILTNHAVVHNLVYDEAGTLVSIGVIVERTKYPLISTVEKNGELIFHSGYTEAWETTTNQQMEQLLFGHGIYLKDVVELPITLKYYDVENEYNELSLADFISNEADYNHDKEIYPSFIRTQAGQANEKYDVILTTPYPYAKIIHYNLDGTNGHYMDALGLNSDKSYSSKTGLFTYVFKEDYAEGYYEIIFGAKDVKENITLCQKVCFIIEQDDYEIDNSLTMNLNFLTSKLNYDTSEAELKSYMETISSSALLGNYKGYLNTSIFENIEAIKAEVVGKTATTGEGESATTSLVGVDIKYSGKNANNEDVNTVFEHIFPNGTSVEKGVAKKEFIYTHNNERYKVVLYFKEKNYAVESTITNAEEATVSTKVFTLLYDKCEVFNENGINNVSSGTSLEISRDLFNLYSNYAIQIVLVKTTPKDSVDSTYKAEARETDNYKECVFSHLSVLSSDTKGKDIEFTGCFSKVYFDNLLIRGIDLKQKIENVEGLKYSNLFNNVNKYGSFRNQEINEVYLVMNQGTENEIKIPLFYDFTGNRYLASEKTITQLANILGVDDTILSRFLREKRLSNESVNLIIDSILSDKVIDALNSDETKKQTEDLLKLVGFIFTQSGIDLSNLYVKIEENEDGEKIATKMFHAENLVEFIESLNVEFGLSNGETVTTKINVNY